MKCPALSGYPAFETVWEKSEPVENHRRSRDIPLRLDARALAWPGWIPGSGSSGARYREQQRPLHHSATPVEDTAGRTKECALQSLFVTHHAHLVNPA